MGLLDRVAAVFRRGAAESPASRTTSDELLAAGGRGQIGGPVELAAEMRASLDRRATIRACREMYRADTRAHGVIGNLARDMVRGGFSVEIDDAAGGQDEMAAEIAEDLQDRLDLDQRLDDWIRLSLRDGDSFLELAVDGRLDIASVTRKPTLEMRRNSNSRDGFDDPRLAFWQGDEWALEGQPPADAIWYAEWQIIHARWEHDEGSRYGEPLFASATRPYKRMTEGETDMAVRRKTRAGLKYVHKFPPGTDPTVIEQYKRLNKDSLDNPTAAIADFFGTVDLAVVQGDSQLGQIDDVMHQIRTWWLASPLPMSLLGYGQDLNRDVLDKQEEQYRRALEGLRAWPETQIIKPLLERQWLLKGIYPGGLKYRIRWQSVAPVTAASVALAADAGLKLRAIGAPDEVVREVLSLLLPGVELGEEWAAAAGGPSTALRSAQDAQPARGNGERETRARPGRIAQAADELQVTG